MANVHTCGTVSVNSSGDGSGGNNGGGGSGSPLDLANPLVFGGLVIGGYLVLKNRRK